MNLWTELNANAEAEGLNVLQYFMSLYMPEVFTHDASQHHADLSAEICDLNVEKSASDGHRGLAKSVFLSRGMATMLPVIRNDDGSYRFNKLYLFTRVGGPGSLAVQWMSFFQDMVTGHSDGAIKYQRHTGFKSGDTWTQAFCKVSRPDGSVFEFHCQGKGGSTRGARDQKAAIMLDDIQDAADQQSPTVLASDELWFVNDVYPVLMPGQYARAIGQNLSPESLMARIEQMPSFRYRRFPLEEPIGSGKSTWPALWSDEWMARQKIDMGLDSFNAEYNCIPMVSGNPIFRKEWFVPYDSRSEQFAHFKNCRPYTVLGFDGSESTADAACETAVITFSCTDDPDPDVYLRYVFHDQKTVKTGVKEIFIGADRVEPTIAIVESRVSEGNEGPYEEEFKEQRKVLKSSLQYRIVRPTADKVTRARYVQGMAESKKIHYDPSIPEHVEWLTQMCMFTGKQKFPADMVDAAVHALTDIKDHAKSVRPNATAKRVLPQGAQLKVMRVA